MDFNQILGSLGGGNSFNGNNNTGNNNGNNANNGGANNNINNSNNNNFVGGNTANFGNGTNNGNSLNFGGGGNNNMLQSILPMLMGGGGGTQNPTELLGMLGKNNPNLSGLMSMLPNLQAMGRGGNLGKKNKAKKTTEYVKVSDYYKK